MSDEEIITPEIALFKKIVELGEREGFWITVRPMANFLEYVRENFAGPEHEKIMISISESLYELGSAVKWVYLHRKDDPSSNNSSDMLDQLASEGHS